MMYRNTPASFLLATTLIPQQDGGDHGSALLQGAVGMGMLFGVNPIIVKQFRPKDNYLKRLIIGAVADSIVGFVWSKISQ